MAPAIAPPPDDAERAPSPAAAGTRVARPRPPTLRYLGFRNALDGREYLMQVGDGEPRTFVLLVTHEAFASRQMRFQDAPDLCFRRMERELAVDPDLVPEGRLLLTSDELREYRCAHEPSAGNRKPR
jgi:hypothetical protein